MWARALVATGRAEQALPWAQMAVSFARAGGLLEMFSGTAELALAEVKHALGQPDEAREALSGALARVTAIADRLAEPSVRERFLESPHPNGEIVALAKAWSVAG